MIQLGSAKVKLKIGEALRNGSKLGRLGLTKWNWVRFKIWTIKFGQWIWSNLDDVYNLNLDFLLNQPIFWHCFWLYNQKMVSLIKNRSILTQKAINWPFLTNIKDHLIKIVVTKQLDSRNLDHKNLIKRQFECWIFQLTDADASTEDQAIFLYKRSNIKMKPKLIFILQTQPSILLTFTWYWDDNKLSTKWRIIKFER